MGARRDITTGRLARVLVLLGVLAVGVAGGWWAGRTAVVRPVAAETQDAVVTAQVSEATVGQSVAMGAAAVQTFVQVASNSLAGVVTSLGSGEIGVGDALYTVGSTPVRAVVGEVPFWRPLGPGDKGVDVVQLQRALIDLGHLESDADGSYGPATTAAVRDWQRAAGVPVTGTVALGELVAIPQLPDAVRLDEAIMLGAILSGGEPAVFARAGAPRVVVPLAAPDGGPVCGQECASVPADARTLLRAQVQTVPDVSGPSVPVAAVGTNAQGQAYVTLSDGSTVPVDILGAEGGVVVVSGLERGQVVILPGSAEPEGGTVPGDTAPDDAES